MVDKWSQVTIFFITCKESITFSDYLHAAANAKHLLKEQFKKIQNQCLTKPNMGACKSFFTS